MQKDYKDTLFLPQTSFPMRANLAQREPDFLKYWEEINLYEELKKKNKDKKSFILHDGPPYANAGIHIGTATNKILKDFVVKYKWQRGYFSPFVPGYDTHGLPIELKVLKEQGIDRDNIAAVELRDKCAEYARKFAKVQTEQFKRLGVIADWENPYMTLVPAYEATQLEGFSEMVEKDLVYKGQKAIYWCTDCQTALAAAEIEYSDETSPSIFVAYKYDGATKIFPELKDKDVNVIIWTTTPWTIPASMAVALNPNFSYGFYEASGKVYLLAEEMRDIVSQATGLNLTNPIILCKGSQLEKTEARHPFYDRITPLVLANYVTLESGTGCVHTAPGHGTDDYETGMRYGIDIYNPVDETGHYYKDTPIFAGMSLSDGGNKVLELLVESDRLLGHQKISHSYPHCWRCKKPVIFRATDQWFVAVTKFKEKALSCIENVQWIPEWGKERMSNMLKERSDWCISRQRIWGVPIPAFYCEDCGQVILTKETVLSVAEKVREFGSNCWWDLSVEELIGNLGTCPKCKSKNLKKETDIMDVWFDSGSSHSAVLDNWEDLSWPADLYLEGSDQHRGWFQTPLLNSVATRDLAPYKAVLTHGFIMAGDGKKMSKSLGNAMTPEKIIDKNGADILRLWVASSDYRGDVRISNEIFENLIESYRRIRNTARFLLANLKEFNTSTDIVSLQELSDVDKYIIVKLNKIRERVTKGFDEYEFHQPMIAIHQFCDYELSSFYIDINKDSLYADAKDSLSRRSVRTVMWEVLKMLTQMISPVLSFTAEEIWQHLREMDSTLTKSVFLYDWPLEGECVFDNKIEKIWDRVMDARQSILRGLESARSTGEIGHPLDAHIQIMLGADYECLKTEIPIADWEKISIVSSCEIVNEIKNAKVLYEDPSTGISVGVTKSSHEKCPRCWKKRPEVLLDGICHRCKDVVG